MLLNSEGAYRKEYICFNIDDIKSSGLSREVLLQLRK
jgi:hypothetical protein